MLRRFLAETIGSSAAEYGLILAIVGVGIGAASLALGGNVTFAIGNAANEIYAQNTAPEEGGG